MLNNYNSIQYGAPDLQNALSHNMSLLYSSFNLFNYTNVFIRMAYSSNIDQIRNTTNFENYYFTAPLTLVLMKTLICLDESSVRWQNKSGQYHLLVQSVCSRRTILKQSIYAVVHSGSSYQFQGCT